MSLVKIEGLGVSLGGQPVLHHVDLDLIRGEIVTIVGPNGSGKSTLLRTILGAIRPDKGKITRAPGLTIGYVPQILQVDKALPLSVRTFLDLPKKVSNAQAKDALDRVGAADLSRRQLRDLSGGQMQRVLLARAVIGKPDLLLLDEATQGLDQQGSAEFYRLIEELRRDMGCAILMVSHELHVVMAASDRVICLNGHVCCHGTPEHVASAPEYRALFGSGTQGALALYRHEHDHAHTHEHDH
ncbi:MAG: metal ABC transporter ATP-binding protein [Silicimonas sp.]|nr:metal ABC transporter ATP-binding protein [Silicimonas sp.]